MFRDVRLVFDCFEAVRIHPCSGSKVRSCALRKR